MTTSTKKIDIAAEYLHNALQLYKDRHFFSALTLGAVAEEILGRAIEPLPEQVAGIPPKCKNALTEEIESQQFFDRALGLRSQAAKAILKQLLQPKNSAKHFNDPAEDTVDLDDQQFTAAGYLLNAIRNYRKVFPHSDEQYDHEEEDITIYQMSRVQMFQVSGNGNSP